MSDMKTLLENFNRFTEGRFTGGSIDIEPLSDEEQTAGTEAYYELFEFLADSNLPGSKPSEKLQYALRWIAKFEQGGTPAGPSPSDEPPMSGPMLADKPRDDEQF
jgi:hypothetical protein